MTKRKLNGGVYIIQGEHLGIVKIGRSFNPEDRIEDLRRSGPWPLRIVGIVSESNKMRTIADLEIEYHHCASSRRLHGEWFAFTLGEIAELEMAVVMGDRDVARVLKRICKAPINYTEPQEKSAKESRDDHREKALTRQCTIPMDVPDDSMRVVNRADAAMAIGTDGDHVDMLGKYGAVRMYRLGRDRRSDRFHLCDLRDHAVRVNDMQKKAD